MMAAQGHGHGGGVCGAVWDHHISLVAGSLGMAGLAASFWAAVQDCLVEFHHLERGVAAAQVTSLWRRLPKGPSGDGPSFEDMIYHEEPWYIACNLAGTELPLRQYQPACHDLLKRNGLA